MVNGKDNKKKRNPMKMNNKSFPLIDTVIARITTLSNTYSVYVLNDVTGCVVPITPIGTHLRYKRLRR